MISFASDYIAGAHPVIMQRLLETNMENLSGYGTDQYCAQAKEKIKQAFQCPEKSNRKIHRFVNARIVLSHCNRCRYQLQCPYWL